MPVVDVDALTVQSPTPTLQAVVVSGVPTGSAALSVDTSGTTIVAGPSGGNLVMTGNDTLEHYQAVLRTLTLQGSGLSPGQTQEIDLYAVDANGMRGPTTHALVTIENPPPPVIDLDGTSASNNFSTKFAVGSLVPVPIVDPVGLSISAPGWSVLDGARVEIESAPGELNVVTQGTQITAANMGYAIQLYGTDTIEHYEQVLRSLTYSTQFTAANQTVQIQTKVFAGQWEGAPATSFVTLIAPTPPTIDLNGDAPGDGYATEQFPGGPPVSIVDPEHLSIDSSQGTVDRATLEIVSGTGINAGGQINVNTAGTLIFAQSQGNGLQLWGTDTVEHYEQVLRTATITNAYGGTTIQVRFTLASNFAGTGPAATSSILVYQPTAPVVDLNGDAPGTGYSTAFIVNQPAVPLVDATGLTVQAFGSTGDRLGLGDLGTESIRHVQRGHDAAPIFTRLCSQGPCICPAPTRSRRTRACFVR